ncbi:MAG: hypothetical protein JXB49_26520 [Bacteroidales bacterium]|nr:hypothetical protein [Bacteroidales bacterium]
MKPEKVVFLDSNLQVSFESLSNKDPLKKGLTKAIRDIQEDASCGRNVKKKLIPKKLLEKYKINNLWIYNLPNSWRLIYSIAPTHEIQIIAAILCWMNHKEYERLFKFT